MLQPRSRDTLAYAGLGWRFLAVTIDTILASFILAIPLSLAAQASGLDLSHYTRPFERNATLFPLWVYVLVFGGSSSTSAFLSYAGPPRANASAA